MIKNSRFTCLIVFFLMLIGCAHIPKESVQLSEELTSMINSARAAHLRLVDEYIAERHRNTERFMEEKWIPDFLSNFVNESKILEDISGSDTYAAKAKKMLFFAQAALKEISKRRDSIIEALDKVELLMKEKISAHYADMLMVNQALTAHLRSAAEVSLTRKELLEQLKLDPERLIPIEDINRIVSKITNYEGKLEDLSDIIGQVKNLLKGE